MARARVWRVGLDQPPAVVAGLAAQLDDREAEAAANRSGSARDRYVVAHGALREILAAEVGGAPGAITFDRRCLHCGHATHGRPRLVRPRAGATPGAEFSLSHSEGHALVGVAGTARIGIDIETIRPRRSLDGLARRVLTPEEYTAWVAVPAPGRLCAFLRHWTAREAYLKGLGIGVFRSLHDVPAAPDGWAVVALDVGPDAVAALALEEPEPPSVTFATWLPGAAGTLAS